MHAIQPSKQPLQSRETRQVATRQKNTRRRLNRHPYRVIALENTAKLLANVIVCLVAVYGLARLLPYLWLQQQKWQEINTEVQQAQGRVDNLRQDFNRYFDSREANTLMKEQTNLLEPGQKQVFWQNQPKK